ncbi:MAG: class I SAM-dependent methyltransferase, partial [Vicinamibacterales bacterium]
MPKSPPVSIEEATRQVRTYWNSRIHDLEMTHAPVGSREFFDELDDYRFDKLAYLPRVVDFSGYAGRRVLEVGCGIGTDLVRFARGGARVIGVDLSETAIRLAARNLETHACEGRLLVGDGTRLPIAAGSVDLVYAHGVLQYAPDPAGIVREAVRVLKPGGEAVFMVYNRVSWLNAMSKLTGVRLEHEDAPILRLYSAREFRDMLAGFAACRVLPERFPV